LRRASHVRHGNRRRTQTDERYRQFFLQAKDLIMGLGELSELVEPTVLNENDQEEMKPWIKP